MAYSDLEILEAIRNGKDDLALKHLYKTLLPKIKQLILKNSGDIDEANDIFQDAVIIFYKQVKLHKFKEEYTIAGFIYSISRNLWINRVKQMNRTSPLLTDHEHHIEINNSVLHDLISEERQQTINHLLSQLGDRCKELLTYSIFNNYSMKEICEKMGFVSENGAKTRNYKCKQKLISLVEDNPSIRQLLKGVQA